MHNYWDLENLWAAWDVIWHERLVREGGRVGGWVGIDLLHNQYIFRILFVVAYLSFLFLHNHWDLENHRSD